MGKNMEKRILSIILAALVIVSMLSTMVLATGTEVDFVDKTGAAQKQSAATLTGDNAAWTGWLYANANTDFDSEVKLTGDTTLIVKDGVTVNVNAGIDTDGHTLTVCGQSEATGKLNVNGKNGDDRQKASDGQNGGNGGNGGDGGNGTTAINGNLVVSGITVNVNGGCGGDGGDGGNGADGVGEIEECGNPGGCGGDGGDGGTAKPGIHGKLVIYSGDVTVNGGDGGTGGTGGNAGKGAEALYGGSGGDSGEGGYGADGAAAIDGDVEIYGGSLKANGGLGGTGGNGGKGGDSGATGGSGGYGCYGGDGGNGGFAVTGKVTVFGGDATLTGGTGGNGGKSGVAGKDSYGDDGVSLGDGDAGKSGCAVMAGTKGDVVVNEGTLELLSGEKNQSCYAAASYIGLPTEKDVTLIETQTYEENNYSKWDEQTGLDKFYAIRIYNEAPHDLTVPEMLKEAATYEYDDYTYTGNTSIVGYTDTYTIDAADIDDGKAITADLARFLGALWRFDEGNSVKTITYAGDEYTWNTSGANKGSNWEHDGTTLVSAIVKNFETGMDADGSTLSFTINDDTNPVTINLIIMAGLTATGTEGADYEWSDNELIIKSNGLTVSGATATQYILVNSDVSSLTLDGVKIIPTDAGIIDGITCSTEELTITLEGDNQIGNAVIYSEGTAENSYADATDESDYEVETGIYAGNLVFTGSGNLTIYDRAMGIKAKNVTFNESFTGKLTVEDFGRSEKCAVRASENISLLGGTFKLTSYKSNGIYAGGSVTIDDAIVTINSGRKELDPGEGVGEVGIYAEKGNVTISGTADVAVGGKKYGIYVEEGDIFIGTADDDTASVLADGYEGGIKTDDGDIEIKAGTVKTRSHKWAIGVGEKNNLGETLGSGDITISGSKTEVVAFGGVENKDDYKYGCGIYAVGGSVTVKDGAGVIAKGYDYGIGAENNVTIQGTTTNVNAEGGYSAPDVPAFENNNTGDDIEAYGIFSKNGTITVRGGTVVAHGCDGAFRKAPDLTGYKVSEVSTWAILGGDDAASAEKKSEASACASVKYAEVFSKILKEELSINASNNVQIAGKEVSDAKLSCYGITYVKTNKILTLDGLTQNMSAQAVDTANSVYAIKLPAGINIVLKGENTITAPKTSGSQKIACGIFSNGVLTVNGDDTTPGTLTINGGASSKGMSYGIYAAGDLSIDGDPTITVTGGNGVKVYGIYSKGNATISSGTISAMGKTAAVAVDTDNSKTLTVGAAVKTATLTNATISKSNGTVTGGVLTSTVTDDPVVISFDPVIVVTKNGASFPVAGEANTEYQLYTVSAENFASDPTLKLEWKDGDAWNGSAPTGVMLDTDGKIVTTADTVAGTYTFRITNSVAETIDTPEVGTPNPDFVSSGEITLTITEAEAEGECTYNRKITTPENGESYELKLNGKSAGRFEFSKVPGGWTIREAKEDGKYLTVSGGRLILSDNDFVWTYENGMFSVSYKSVQKTSGHWVLFIYVPGTTKTLTTTYYLSSVQNDAILSTSPVETEFVKMILGEHSGICVNCGEYHKIVCTKCGNTLEEYVPHTYDEITHECECGAFDLDFKSVDVLAMYQVKTQKKSLGLIGRIFGLGKTVTTYTATVYVDTVGVKVVKVEVSARENGGWTEGSTFTSDKQIKQFFTRITTSDGVTQLYMVVDGVAYPAD